MWIPHPLQLAGNRMSPLPTPLEFSLMPYLVTLGELAVVTIDDF